MLVKPFLCVCIHLRRCCEISLFLWVCIMTIILGCVSLKVKLSVSCFESSWWRSFRFWLSKSHLLIKSCSVSCACVCFSWSRRDYGFSAWAFLSSAHIKINHWFRRIVQPVDQKNQPTDWNIPVKFYFYQAIGFISKESCPDFSNMHFSWYSGFFK